MATTNKNTKNFGIDHGTTNTCQIMAEIDENFTVKFENIKDKEELKTYGFQSKPDDYGNILFKFNGDWVRPAVLIAGFLQYLNEAVQTMYSNYIVNTAVWAFPIRFHNKQRKALLDASM